MKEKIILLAHGSSDLNWSDTFVHLTRPACEQNKNVQLAFMELSSPSLELCVKRAAKEGYQKVTVLPLFLAKGKHLKKDVPGMLESYASTYGVATQLLDPIGEHPALADALLRIIEETVQDKE